MFVRFIFKYELIFIIGFKKKKKKVCVPVFILEKNALKCEKNILMKSYFVENPCNPVIDSICFESRSIGES